MPIDREQALKRAEKLLRQGRLEAAIAEYVQVVRDYPRDWTTANLLGDLYVRANQIGEACAQFVRIAEHLASDGFVAKAAAVYKKILKLNPSDEDALVRAAELAAQQGLTADVRLFMTSAFQLRLKRGDRAGAVQLARRRVAFDPADIVGRLDAARMLAEAGDQAGAAGELRAAGLALESQGRVADAVRPLREALRFAPGDLDTRSALLRLYLQLGDTASAADVAQSAEHLRVLLADARQRGPADLVHDLLVRIATADPEALDVRLEIARTSLDRGDAEGAARWAAVEHVAEHPELALTLAEADLRLGRVDDGQRLVAQALAKDHALRASVSGLIERLTPDDPRAAGAVVLAAVDACVERGETAWALVRMEAFVAAVPDALPVLRRHIDVCVDAGRTDDLPIAQLRLADALLRQGAFQEARVIAEDLVASFPDDERYRGRLTDALQGLGLPAEPMADGGPDLASEFPALDDDAPLSLELDTGSSALSDDFSDLVEALATDASKATEAEPRTAWPEPEPDVEFPLEPAQPPLQVCTPLAPASPEPAPEAPSVAIEPAVPPEDRYPAPDIADEAVVADVRRPGSPRIDLLGVGEDLLRIFEGRPPRSAEPEPAPPVEIDLSDALAGMKREPDVPAPPASQESDPTLEGFFLGLRDQAAERMSEAERNFREGEEAYVAGDVERALGCYRVAAREPGVRFRASWAIARIAKERGHLAGAIEWLERASEVPATSPELWQSLVYELGDTLVAAGEHARALAVFMELRAATPGYRDVDTRIGELSEGQSEWRQRADGVHE